MSAYQALVLKSVCRSNHHRIAILALDHLQCEAKEMWRDVFLKHHVRYLEGAKAPDEEFKDFMNHVCHPADNFWGGAPKAAAEWYRRTRRALDEGDWEQAAWNAGVMSHYLADPCQPFHTGQTEAEGVIHRAVEWSCSKAFPELNLIIDQHVGWPDLAVPTGEDWIEQMVRAAATQAHTHYHAMIDHFDFEAARGKPEHGLDQELKDIVAGQIAYASVLTARVLDRAIVEAQAAPPKVSLVMPLVAETLKRPVHATRRALANAADAKVVRAQHTEFRRSGKVRNTLGEDDQIVRRIHAEEVSKRHLSTLDSEWPREAGLAHGQGAEPREHRKLKKVKPPKPPREETPVVEDRVEKPAKKTKPEKVRKQADAPKIVEAEFETPAVETSAVETPSAAPVKPEPTMANVEPARKGPRLARDADVVDAPSIGPKTASRFHIIGVKTVADLLALAPDDAAKRIKASHINARQIRDWQAQALLACSVPDLPGAAAQLLVGAGVSTPADLAAADANYLAGLVKEFARSKDGDFILRGAAPPDEAKVASWIAAAKAA